MDINYYEEYYRLAKQNSCRLIINPGYDDELAINSFHTTINDAILFSMINLLMNIKDQNMDLKIYINSNRSNYIITDIDIIEIDLGVNTVERDKGVLIIVKFYIEDNILYLDDFITNENNEIVGYNLKEEVPIDNIEYYQFISFMKYIPFKLYKGKVS